MNFAEETQIPRKVYLLSKFPNVKGGMDWCGEFEPSEFYEKRREEEAIEMQKLMTTGEWQELLMFREKYPRFYLKTFMGRVPRSVEEIKDGIDSINQMITEGSESD
jgi:hypothetical protein